MTDVFTGLIPDSDEVRADFEAAALPMSWNYREYFNQLDVLIDETHDVTQWLKIENQGGVGSCFPAGTKVTLADGSLKNIEDIRFADYVLTHSGCCQPVIDTMRRDYTGQLYEFFVKGWGWIRMTADHVVRVLRGDREIWLPAEEVTETDMLIVSKGIRQNPSQRLDISNYLQLDRLCEDNGFIRRTDGGNKVNRILNLDANTCWVIGHYVAEGSSSYSRGYPCRAVWTVHDDEVSHCLPRISEFAASIGLSARIQSKSSTKATNIIVDSTIVGDFLSNTCGRFCNHKRVPEFILRGTDEQQLAFLRGYYFGDGSDSKYGFDIVAASGNTCVRRQLHCATASKVLAQQVSTMMVQLGMKPGRTVTKARSHQNHDSHQVFIYGEDAKHLMGDPYDSVKMRSAKWTTSGQARKIREIRIREVRQLEVYDFTVSTDHSFVADGIVVHNCQGNALTTGAEAVHYYRSGCQNVIQLSRLFAYIGSQEHGGGARGDTGSSMISGIRLLQKVGIPLESTVPYTDRYNTMVSKYREASRNQQVLEEAKKFIVPDHLVCESFEQAMAWVACRCGSVHIGMNWPIPLDSRAIAGNYSRAGGGGHAIEGVTCQKIDGTWYLKIANSHSTRYGDAGYFYMGKQTFEDVRRSNRFGVYLIGAPGTWEEPRYTGQFPLMG